MSDWFPWYPVLFKVDTLHLTAAQDGIYRRLIDWYMETRRPLPDNDQALAGIARVGLQEWLDVASTVRPYFVSKAGKLHQKRCDNELDGQDKRAKRRSEVGRKGAEARHSKNKDIDATGIPGADPELADGIDDASLEPAPGTPEAELRLGTSLLHDRTRQDKTEESTPQTPKPLKRDALFFTLKTIRLTKEDYNRWKTIYSAIPDFDAELNRIEDSLVTEAERKSWFVSTSAKLNFAHKKYLAEAVAQAAGAPPTGRRMNGDAPRKWSVAERVAKKAEWGMQRASPAEVKARVYAEGLGDVWTFGE